jgi:hypothetical protein
LQPAESLNFYADITTLPPDDELIEELIELGELDGYGITDSGTLLQCDMLFQKLPQKREGAMRWCGAIKPAGLPCTLSACAAGGSAGGPRENHRPRSLFEKWLKRIWRQ